MSDEVRNFLWHVHDYQCKFIMHADTKAAVLFAWSTGILAWHSQHSSLACLFPTLEWNFRFLQSGISVAGYVLPILSSLLSAIVISPVLKIAFPIGVARETYGEDLIYWESIRSRTEERYIEEVDAKSRLERCAARHIHALAAIAVRKYRIFTVAFWVAVVGTLFAFLNYAISVKP